MESAEGKQQPQVPSHVTVGPCGGPHLAVQHSTLKTAQWTVSYWVRSLTFNMSAARHAS